MSNEQLIWNKRIELMNAGIIGKSGNRLVKNGENGILIPMNQEKALLDGMVKIATDTAFSNLQKHSRRIAKVMDIEK